MELKDYYTTKEVIDILHLSTLTLFRKLIECKYLFINKKGKYRPYRQNGTVFFARQGSKEVIFIYLKGVIILNHLLILNTKLNLNEIWDGLNIQQAIDNRHNFRNFEQPKHE